MNEELIKRCAREAEEGTRGASVGKVREAAELAIRIYHACAVKSLVEAVDILMTALVEEYGDPDQQDGDEGCVGWNGDGSEMPISFKMLTDVRKALAPFQKETPMIELTFHPISTAPLDGTEVWLRNSMIGRPVKGRYTDYSSPWGSVSKQWVLTDDPLGELIGIPAGTRIIPDEWASADLMDQCPGCGDGDKVPASGYWRCPECDAEWPGEE